MPRRARSTTSAAAPPTATTHSACSAAARSPGPGRSTPHEALAHRQRRAARGRRRLGGREPAVRAARPPRPAGLQERVRAGRVRLVLGLPRRRARVRLPGPGGAGRGTRGRDRRGHRAEARAARDPARVRRGRRRPVRLLHAGTDRGRPRPARAHAAGDRSGDPRGAGGQPVPLHGLREDPRCRPAGGGEDGRMTLAIDGCAVATVDAAGTEYRDGHIVVEDDRIAAVGPGPAPAGEGRRIDGRGCLATPGLVNCHHHLYQWATRGLAQQATLFEWLVELYPVWARLDGETQDAAARAGLAALARSGCTTSTDHHYVFPEGAGDLLEIEVEAARAIGVRFHPCRGSMDLGRSAGGLPPDEVVEDRDVILAASEAAIDRFHDPSPGAMVRVALAPCSPFSVTRELMADAAELARKHGVRLHTHLAETLDEEEFCLELFGVRPVQCLEDLGWLGEDVWLAHCVHLSADEVRQFGATGTGVAHCPSSNARLGAGIAPVAGLLQAGAPVGLGVDGAASNEAGELGPEVRQALLFARLAGGPAAMTAREALGLGTIEGAKCLGRAGELGSLEPGKLADVALWRVDADIQDPTAALVLGAPRPVDTLLVGGRPIVEGGELRTADEEELARNLARV